MSGKKKKLTLHFFIFSSHLPKWHNFFPLTKPKPPLFELVDQTIYWEWPWPFLAKGVLCSFVWNPHCQKDLQSCSSLESPLSEGPAIQQPNRWFSISQCLVVQLYDIMPVLICKTLVGFYLGFLETAQTRSSYIARIWEITIIQIFPIRITIFPIFQ